MKHINFWLGVIFFSSMIILAIFFKQSIRYNKKNYRLSLNKIEKIEISQGNLQKVTLTNDNGVWLVNGIIPIKYNHLKQIYNIVLKMKKKQKVNEHILFDVRNELMNSPEVRIWSNGRIVKSFYIGQPISDSSGNYYMPSDDMLAFVVYVPGQRCNLQDYFVTYPNYWRDSHVLQGILKKAKFMIYHEPKHRKKKKHITNSLRQQLFDIQTSKYIDEAGLIDSLHWKEKRADYLCKIEFLNSEEIPKAKFTCFDLGHRFLALLEDFGGNCVAVTLTKKDLQLLRKVNN